MMELWLAVFLALVGPPLPPESDTAGGSTVYGTVTDSEGRPLAGIPILIEQDWEEDAPPSAVSGPDGSFAISGLPPGKIDLYACGKGYVYGSRTVWFRDEPVHFEMERAATLRGFVLGPEGAPVAGAHVLLREAPMILAEDGMILHSSGLWPPCGDSGLATSEADGRFELASIRPGRYSIDVSRTSLLLEEAPLYLRPLAG